MLCLASNGLGIAPYLDELAELQVSHVTITVNAVDPEIGAKIYSWVRDGKVIYRGRQAAEVLLARQLEAIVGLKARGIVVKINTIVIPGINDHHVEAVARKMQELGVDLLNCMPVYPNADTPFGEIPEPAPGEDDRHSGRGRRNFCPRCATAPAAGPTPWACWTPTGPRSSAAASPPAPRWRPPWTPTRPYVAVASREGVLVNLHLGEADAFQIWGPEGQGFRLLEERPAPPPGGGDQRWWEMAEVLQDCRAVLVSALGETPAAILSDAGVVPVEMSGFIEVGLSRIYSGEPLTSLKGRKGGLTRACSGKGMGKGCM